MWRPNSGENSRILEKFITKIFEMETLGQSEENLPIGGFVSFEFSAFCRSIRINSFSRNI